MFTDLPGVDLEVQPIRDYPYGAIGFASLRVRRRDHEGRIQRLKMPRILAERRDRQRRPGVFATTIICAACPAATRRRRCERLGRCERRLCDRSLRFPATTLITTVDWRLQRNRREALAKDTIVGPAGRPLSGAVVVGGSLERRDSRACELSELRSERFAANKWKRVSYDLTEATQPLSIERLRPRRRPDPPSRW